MSVAPSYYLNLLRSLSHLTGYPRNYLEIEQSFADGIETLTEGDPTWANALIAECRVEERFPTSERIGDLARQTQPHAPLAWCPDCHNSGWVITHPREANGARPCTCGLKLGPPMPIYTMDRKQWERWWGKEEV